MSAALSPEPDEPRGAGLSDDQLIGFLSGTRRMESRLAWARMAALAEFASRPRRQDFAADEVASAFRLTWLSAAGEIGYARTVARRLPVTFAALAAGKLDPVHVKIIEDVTSILSDEDAEDRYRPSRKLQHLIRARNTTCAAPGCGRRAACCDLDHTDPHHQGGRTCECNLAPSCQR